MQDTLIIGGAGFIGSRYIRDAEAAAITVFDNFSEIVHTPASRAAFEALGTETIEGDVTRTGDVEALFDRGIPKNLLLLAAETGTGRSLQNCVLNTDVNVMGMAIVLDALSRRGTFPQRIVLTSSRAVYGEGPYQDAEGRLVYPEQRAADMLDAGQFDFEGLTALAMNAGEHLPKPSNIYGTTKLAQENLLWNWARAFGVDATILRLQNVYGAGQSLSNPYTGVLIHFLRMLDQGMPVEIYEQGGITRDFVHVADVASAIRRAFDPHTPPGIYDIGEGERRALEDVAARLCTLTARPAPVFCDRYRLGDVRHAAADITRAEALLGWSPDTALDDGLAELLDFFRTVKDA